MDPSPAYQPSASEAPCDTSPLRARCQRQLPCAYEISDAEASQWRRKIIDSGILESFICAVERVDRTHIEVLQLLVKHGAPLNGALHRVGYYDSNVPFIEPLLKAGADIEELMNNRTPLAMAALYRSPGVCRALLRAGANVNGLGHSALFSAISSVSRLNTASTVKVLCDAGADTTRLSDLNHSVFSFALTSCDDTYRDSRDTLKEVIKAVCEGGGSVNFHHRGVPGVVVNGDTPLHIAT
jgi:ankyrin repeat protein